MLKKAIAIAITLPILGLGNAAIAADESSSAEATGGKDWNVSVGLKLWRNDWNLPLYTDSQAIEYHSNTELTIIPVLSARYNNWMVSGSYFSKTDYSFGFNQIAFKDGSTYPDVSITAERTEFDINVGYSVLPSLVVTLGYKQIDRKYSILQFGNTIPNTDQDNKTSGFTLGFAASAPLSDQIGLYGSFGYGLNVKTKSLDGTYDTDYYLGEVGLSYGKILEGVPVLDSASAYIGYRVQALVDHNDFYSGASTLADYTQGFVIGANLSF